MKIFSSRAAGCGVFLLLSACGGGGSRPQPAPPPPPPPPPPPAAASAFPIETSNSFEATTADRVHIVDPGTGRNNFQSLEVAGRGPTVTIRYDAEADTYTITDEEGSLTVGSADRTSSTGYVEVYAKDFEGVENRLEVFGNVRSAGSQEGAPLQLTYLSYGIWSQGADPSGVTQKTYLLFGFPTTASDMPRTGSASYQTAVVGSLLRIFPGGSAAEAEVGGSGSFSANFGTGAVNTELALHRIDDQTPLGTYLGTGTISADQFTGVFQSQSPFF